MFCFPCHWWRQYASFSDIFPGVAAVFWNACLLVGEYSNIDLFSHNMSPPNQSCHKMFLSLAVCKAMKRNLKLSLNTWVWPQANQWRGLRFVMLNMNSNMVVFCVCAWPKQRETIKDAKRSCQTQFLGPRQSFVERVGPFWCPYTWRHFDTIKDKAFPSMTIVVGELH